VPAAIVAAFDGDGFGVPDWFGFVGDVCFEYGNGDAGEPVDIVRSLVMVKILSPEQLPNGSPKPLRVPQVNCVKVTAAPHENMMFGPFRSPVHYISIWYDDIYRIYGSIVYRCNCEYLRCDSNADIHLLSTTYLCKLLER
jgi:hypothetical protein